MPQKPHTFHIPVMGTGFTIDTPLRVARYGISSVVSLVDDILIEQVRKYHSTRLKLPYVAITNKNSDPRAERIKAYLNLLDGQVKSQVEVLRNSPFQAGSQIERYFELLPESPLKDSYRSMSAMEPGPQKDQAQDALRAAVSPGSIDVNIMTKLDCDSFSNGTRLPVEFASAMAALRGFAKSSLNSAVVFSAGFNRRLYNYAAQFEDFLPSPDGQLKKKIVLKVSDYRSALVQGKFLAKLGLWVSEFRIESGLNCGGHAFATVGHLLGPVLDEFMQKRMEMSQTLGQAFIKAMEMRGRRIENLPSKAAITVQGGIGTADENRFLMHHYHLEGTGWGTPFLLVPEATNVDYSHISKMIQAKSDDVFLSDSSPLGVPFWNLRTSASEEARLDRIAKGKPGSACPKHFVALNTEFGGKPLCPASKTYIKLKLDSLAKEGHSEAAMANLRESVLAKSCLCHDLAGCTTLNYHIAKSPKPSICCGPNILSFKHIASLDEMVDHIYGRLSLTSDTERPHMFIQELKLYVEHLRGEIKILSQDLSKRPKGYVQSFRDQLLNGIEYYRSLARQILEQQRERFLADLQALSNELEKIALPG